LAALGTSSLYRTTPPSPQWPSSISLITTQVPLAISTNSIALPTGFHFGLNWLQALVGMKPQYGASIWELSIGSGSGFVDVETPCIFMQLMLLVGGILMISHIWS
jgi:hypothetical protein